MRRALSIFTGGATTVGCGIAGILRRACATSGGGATGVMSSAGAISFGRSMATAATGGACGILVHNTMSGIAALARIFGAAGSTTMCALLSAYFGMAIASATRFRAWDAVAFGALELRLITG